MPLPAGLSTIDWVRAASTSDAAISVAADAIQSHHGAGFTWEHPEHFYFRRATGIEALQGDSRSHRAEIADLIGV